jgi:hypothetical protein
MTTLMVNVAKVYALSDKPLPGGDQGAAVISGWADALTAIPTDWLDRTFSEAIRAHRGGFMVAFGEVLAAWDGMLDVRQQAAQPINTAHLLPGAPRETSYVGNMLIVFKTFCDEHRDPLGDKGALPTRLKYALATVKDCGRAANFRDLLESTGQDTLYEALTALGIAVDPPPPAKPGTVGYWAKVGESF